MSVALLPNGDSVLSCPVFSLDCDELQRRHVPVDDTFAGHCSSDTKEQSKMWDPWKRQDGEILPGSFFYLLIARVFIKHRLCRTRTKDKWRLMRHSLIDGEMKELKFTLGQK